MNPLPTKKLSKKRMGNCFALLSTPNYKKKLGGPSGNHESTTPANVGLFQAILT